jgi:hypothetical protein
MVKADWLSIVIVQIAPRININRIGGRRLKYLETGKADKLGNPVKTVGELLIVDFRLLILDCFPRRWAHCHR